VVIPLKNNAVSQALPRILEDAENGLTTVGRELFADLYEQLQGLSQSIKKYDVQIERLFKTNPICQRLAEVEGVGPVTATALLAAGDANAFKNGPPDVGMDRARATTALERRQADSARHQ